MSSKSKQLVLNFGSSKPIGPFADKLLLLDYKRWCPMIEYGDSGEMNDPELLINKITTERSLQHELATWCFDQGYFEEADRAYELLKKIRKVFGSKMRYRVLICMNTRRHDT